MHLLLQPQITVIDIRMLKKSVYASKCGNYGEFIIIPKKYAISVLKNQDGNCRKNQICVEKETDQ